MATLAGGIALYAHFAHLDDEALLHISGPESLTFLQGQTTCDTRLVTPQQAVGGAYCTPQGRMVCDFLLAPLGDDHFAMRMRADLLPVASETFGKYILFSKAELDAGRTDWRVFACWGQDAAEQLQELFGQRPGEALGVCTGEGYRLIQIDEGGEQFEVWLDTAGYPDQVNTLQNRFLESPAIEWQTLQIAAGRGRVEGSTSSTFLPQDLNYDRIGWVNFTKGCYTGQEIVARLHYRGKPKRRTYPATVQTSEPLPAGATVHADGAQQSVGNLVNSGAGSVLVCVAESALHKQLTLGSPEGETLEIGKPPYSLADGEA